MDTPILPKGYYFEVKPGSSTYSCGYTLNTDARVHIKKKHWYDPILITTVNIPDRVFSHPTPEEVYKAMLLALGQWDKIREEQTKEFIYGQYPPKKLDLGKNK